MFIVAVNISCLRHFFRQIRSPTLKGQAKISSAWAAFASKRFGKGFAAKVTRFLKYARFSPSASSEADLNTRNDLRG